jgi:hypothetical protein
MAWDVSSFDASRGQGRGRQSRGKVRVVRRAPAATSKALAGMAGADDQLGFSFKKLVKGAIHYGNPLGLTYEAAKLGTKLAKKTSIGRGIFDAVDYIPGGGVFNRILGGGGGGGGSKKAAPARKLKPKRKIRIARPAAAPRDEGPPGYPEGEDREAPEDMPGEDQGGGDEGGDEGGGDEGGEEGGEEGDAVEGLEGFWGKVAGGLKSAGKAAGKVGVSIGKTALETYIGRPLGGQTAAQQQQALAKARAAAATPFYKNPIVIGGAAVAAVGAVVLLSKRGRGRRR